MELSELTRTLLAAKKAKGLSFSDLEKVVGRSEVWIAALFYRQSSASQDEAEKVAAALGLDPETAAALTEIPVKGLGQAVPTDPLMYRFHEILQVYGLPLKAVINEKFGDGIMSAVDLRLKVEKEKDPDGDRVRITMSGKFLPFRKW
jgi:cyanate lyase